MAAGINQFSNRRTHNVHTHDGRVHPRTALLSIGGHTFFHETPPTNPPENLCENFTWSAFWSLQVSFVCQTAPGAGTCCGKRAALLPCSCAGAGEQSSGSGCEQSISSCSIFSTVLKATKSSRVHKSNSLKILQNTLPSPLEQLG